MTAVPRFVPMVGDSMEPTIKPGDLVAVLPSGRWYGDDIYVICEQDTPLIVRASSDFRGGVRVSYDNPRYSPWTMTRDEFLAALLGKVFALCVVTDRAVMEDVGVVADWGLPM